MVVDDDRCTTPAGLENLLRESFLINLFERSSRRIFSHGLGGENLLTSAPEAGQASPKTIGNGVRPASQKGPQKWPKMERKTGPKWAPK